MRVTEGHDENFMKLLELRAEDATELRKWLQRTYSYIRADVQNELLILIAHAHRVLRESISELRSNGQTPFTLIVDGTLDVRGIVPEQQLICLHNTTGCRAVC